MGEDDIEKGKVIDWGAKRRERGLSEAKSEEMIRKEREDFAAKRIEEFESKYEVTPDALTDRKKSAAKYNDGDIEKILDAERENLGTYNESFLYVAAKDYLEREKKRQETEHPDT